MSRFLRYTSQKKFRNFLGSIYDKISMDIYNLRRFKQRVTIDLFPEVDIETITHCNRRCSYCPNSLYDMGLYKNKKLMDKALFKKIIDELAEIDFNGRIAPHFYGEPLLDNRLADLIDYIREKLPKSKVIIFTNGDYLTVSLFEKLVGKGVNLFVVTQHGPEMPKNMKLLFDYLKNNPQKKEYIYYERYTKKTPMHNMECLVKPEVYYSKPRCKQAYNPLVINHKGDVILCCNDFHSSFVFGNVKEEKLINIWKSERYKQIRKELKKGVYRLNICKKCVENI